MPFVNGTQVNDDGRVKSTPVADTYVPVATDIFINGTLHDLNGRIYTAFSSPNVGDPFINGIRHTLNGVVRTNAPGLVNSWPEGFSTNDNGTQIVRTTVLGSDIFYRGIRRDLTGAMIVDTT